MEQQKREHSIALSGMGTAQIIIKLIIEDTSSLPNDIVIKLNKDTQEVVARPTTTDGADFFDLMREDIAMLKQQGSARTAEAYKSALNSLSRFFHDGKLSISLFDSEMAMAYERCLKRRGITPNTISFYMRILRAVYNRAVARGLTLDRHPFTKVYTAIGKTRKRAIGMNLILQMKELDCKRKSERLARDLFLFSFYTRGMAFVDMAYLKKQNVRNGILYYTRSKTGQRLSIKWEPAMQSILDRNPTSASSPYLLPIITDMEKDARSQYRYRQSAINRKLKAIGKRLNIGDSLTMYVARHSWASIAKSLNVPTEIISQAMGHTSEKTTLIYLKSIQNEQIDNVNHQILEMLQKDE